MDEGITLHFFEMLPDQVLYNIVIIIFIVFVVDWNQVQTARLYAQGLVALNVSCNSIC